jgi:hypothetical protein
MNLWIVTIGSSDIQLDSDQINQKKGRTEIHRSDKIWRYWYTDELKAENYDVSFEPKPLYKDKEELYRISPRLLGNIYQASSEKVRQKIWSYLAFPLLDNFVKKLEEYPQPEAIAVLLTDQSLIFADANQRRKPKSPYWQDTCELEPILRDYFGAKFPNVPCEFIPLIPDSPQKSLDNWNAVLDLVQNEFTSLTIREQAIALAPKDNVYVSHQAGTPALSSAVQFTSLARFGDRVLFIVSSEQDESLTDTVESSTYLKGIKREQAKVLLKHHDYSGIRDVIGLSETTPITPEIQSIKKLLDAAEQWNFAEFQKFKKIITRSRLFPQADFPWWRMGYESAYLAWVRLQQGSPVDAMFHSFRAVEGSVSRWAEETYKTHTRRDSKKGLQLKRSICTPFQYLDSWFGKANNQPKEEIGLYGKASFALLREARRQDWSTNPNISLFCKTLDRNYSGNDIFDERNNLFHRLEGLQEKELFEDWDASDSDTWIARVLGCLNFISGQNYQFIPFERRETYDEAPSLMVQIHQALEKAIADL